MRTSMTIVCVAGGVIASSAQALVIDLNDTGTTPMSAQQLAAFGAAADLWENTFSDPITVKVNIEFANLDPGVLGSTLTQRTTHPLSNVRSAMHTDAFGTTEKNVVNMLPSGSLSLQDINGSRGDNMVTMATANAKALGLGTGLDPLYGGALPGGADGRIQFANAFAGTFDYDRSDGISAGLTDFTGVAAHEIGHLLGFFSLTDVQDNNPTFTLHANTLDLWRFDQTGGAHSIGSEDRRLTHGPAEYYDSVLNNVQTSRGVHPFEPVDPVSGTSSGRAQASHWRDNLANLMDPTIAPGVQVDIKPDDRHALDYVGYNRPLVWIPYIPRRILVGWFPWVDPGPLIPDFDGAFREFAPPPDPEGFKPPFDPDFAMRLGMDLGVEGMEKRGGLGVVRFAPEQDNQFPVIEGLSAEKGEETTEPMRERPDILPPALMDFYFESDTQTGEPFTARGLLSEAGAQFDPSLGEFGGYRIPIVLDGIADDQMGDTDAMMTILLLASDETGVPDPEKQNLFTVAMDAGDNVLQIFDPVALGTPSGLLGDLNGDGFVGIADLNIVLGAWNQTIPPGEPLADPSGDNFVGIADLNIVLGNWNAGTPPNDTATIPEPAAVILLSTGIMAMMNRRVV